MLKYLILLPIGSSISGLLIPQLLNLKSWCDRNNGDIYTVTGKPHNFARNLLATGGKGFINSGPPDAEILIWVDSDILFTIEQLEELIKIDHPFAAGWYVSDLSNQVMCGNWDIEYFKQHKTIPFLTKDELKDKAKLKIKLLEVDFTGFGFVKMDSSLLKKMSYPYFTLNEQNIDNCIDLSSEDVSFCQNCFKATGIKPAIVTNIQVGHLKSIYLY